MIVAPKYRNQIAIIGSVAQWSFLTNHARALLCIAHDPGLRLRDMAIALGVTERSAYAIVADLTEAGYVLKERDGRRNRYSIQEHMPLPDSTERQRTIGEMLRLLAHTPMRRTPSPRTPRAKPAQGKPTRGRRV
jgi:DNA-binding transcriptional ArsR family regulator